MMIIGVRLSNGPTLKKLLSVLDTSHTYVVYSFYRKEAGNVAATVEAGYW